MTGTKIEPAIPEDEARPRRVWLEGGSSTRAWDVRLIGLGTCLLGLGLIIGLAAGLSAPAPWRPLVTSAAVWVTLTAAIVVAFRRSAPRGLLRFRAVDLVLGLASGLSLRVVAGSLEGWAQGGGLRWPSVQRSEAGWAVTEVLGPVLVAPLLEELFFHGVLLIAVYTVLRRRDRSHLAPGIAAALVTTGLFVLAHVATTSVSGSWTGPISLTVFGLAGAALVLLTGRIWAAVLSHVVYNGSYVGLALIGTVWGAAGGPPGLS